MELSAWAAVNGYTYAVLIILLVVSEMNNVVSSRSRKYKRVLILCVILLTGDSLGRMEFLMDTAPILVKAGTFITFAFDPLGFFFVDDYLHSWMTDVKKPVFHNILKYALLGFSILDFAVCVISRIFEINIFYIYKNNVYERGPLFIPRAATIFILCIIISVYTVLTRKKIEKNYRLSLTAFPFFILVGGLFQVVFPNVQLEYAGISLGSIFNYLFLQSKDSSVDYLTNALNRRAFDSCITRRTSDHETFSGIMIDIDFFNSINDTYGHSVGDEALQLVAHMLRRALTVTRNDVTIYRYGGDEFIVLTYDKTEIALINSVNTIREKMEYYNDRKSIPCRLSLSIGYKVYNGESGKSGEEFLNEIDSLMYEDKKKHHADSRGVA